MKKIMFNDKCGLTQAVLEGRKTQTRRTLTSNLCNVTDFNGYPECFTRGAEGDWYPTVKFAPYQVGEIVAIAQNYKDCGMDFAYVPSINKEECKMLAGWGNKMFVKAELMKHHIKIKNVRVERLQDISDEDCIAEGITVTQSGDFWFKGLKDDTLVFPTAEEAYAALIDTVGKKGTWGSNPWVYVYDFELID